MNKNKIIKINKKSFTISDQIFFSQRLSLLLDSGISLVESLNLIKNIDSSISHKRIYEIIISDIEKGVSLSKSIKNIDLKFNNLLIALIQNGESSGHLSIALSQAYSFLDKKDEIKKKIISSLVYPLFIVVATIVMTLFLILYIFPKIIPLLSSLNIKLPLMTRIVQWLYMFLSEQGLWLFLFVTLLIIVVNLLIKKIESLRYKYHFLIISIPYISKYIKINNMISVCRMGEMLLSSGKSLTSILLFYSQSNNNLVYKKIFNEIHIEVARGVSFSNSLNKHSNFFPITLIDMCMIGEKTGNLSIMLGHSSKIFEQDIDNVLKRFSSLIEPVLMVLMGLIVGSIALSIILPVYEITNHLSK